MRLAFQIISALIVGVCYYMLAIAMTVYDGAHSHLFQLIVGAVIKLVVIFILLVIGLPIRRITRLHCWWKKH